jgi:hypothetical protein
MTENCSDEELKRVRMPLEDFWQTLLLVLMLKYNKVI